MKKTLKKESSISEWLYNVLAFTKAVNDQEIIGVSRQNLYSTKGELLIRKGETIYVSKWFKKCVTPKHNSLYVIDDVQSTVDVKDWKIL